MACEVVRVEPQSQFVLHLQRGMDPDVAARAEGTGTRLFLDHSGFDLNDERARNAFDRMGRGWRDEILPRLAQLVAELPD